MYRRRLTPDQVIEIRRRARDTDETYGTIADDFDVSPSMVGLIAKGRAYQDVFEPVFTESTLDELIDSLPEDDEPYEEPEVEVEAPREWQYDVGDVVRLRSGSPPMTIERGVQYLPETGQPYVTVGYWTPSGVTSARLHPHTLERASAVRTDSVERVAA